jgi:hypothetical protein
MLAHVLSEHMHVCTQVYNSMLASVLHFAQEHLCCQEAVHASVW